jgi:hypothetical protein
VLVEACNSALRLCIMPCMYIPVSRRFGVETCILVTRRSARKMLLWIIGGMTSGGVKHPK